MVDDLTFLRVIGANPDDDGPRLLYADFLEEKGDAASAAHAEFIRVQCALDAAAPGSGNLDALRDREKELLTAHWPTWLRPACQAAGDALPDSLDKFWHLGWQMDRERHNHMLFRPGSMKMSYFHAAQFRRGFLAHVALWNRESRGERHVARLWDRAPIDGLSLMDYSSKDLAKTLAAIEGGERLRSLEIGFTDDDSVTLVATARGLRWLRELILRGIKGRLDAAEVLSQSATLTSLRLLVIESCSVGDDGIARLCRAPFAAGLERLELVKCDVTNAGAIHLARYWPARNRLTHLDMSDNQIFGGGMSDVRDRFGDVLKSSFGNRPWPTRFYL
jgi:uncharacterized protein (TIGR02996 family)